jgi:hypothetical protein
MTELAFQRIAEKFKDMAGKWRVRVCISDAEAIFLKFDHDPSLEEVKNETAKLILSRKLDKQTELDQVNRRIKELQAQKVILERQIASEAVG